MSSPLNEWFAPKPHPLFEHPTLGTFRFEDGVWKANIPQGASTLELSIAGDDAAPNQTLVTAATGLLARFAEVKDAALDFLTSQEEAPSREDFTCYDLELLREEFPNHFSLSFILFGDLGGLWRVEFEDGEPLFLARDD
jgi:hypothetical protein